MPHYKKENPPNIVCRTNWPLHGHAMPGVGRFSLKLSTKSDTPALNSQNPFYKVRQQEHTVINN